jgi:heme a synthase
VAFLVLLARKVWREWAAPGSVGRRLAGALAALAGLQILAGPLTVALGNPVWARLAHLFLADLLWVALVLLATVMLESGISMARPAAAPGRAVPVTP